MSGQTHVIDELGAYALHSLDEAEAARVQAHLAECPVCQRELASLTEVSGRLAELSPDRPPSPDLRGQVIAAVEREAALPSPAAPRVQRPRRLQWAWATLAAVVVFSQAWLVISLISMRGRLDQQAQVQTILLSSDAAPIKLQPSDPASPVRGIYRFDPDLRRGLLNYYHFPTPGSGQSYYCWFDFSAGPAASCGRLQLDGDGSGLLMLMMPPSTPIRIRVTVQADNTSTPTGASVLAADLARVNP